MSGTPGSPPPSGALRQLPPPGVLYAIWGAIGLSILMEFGLLLFLQRGGRVAIADRVGAPGGAFHIVLALALFASTAALIIALRSRLGSAERLVREAGAGARRTRSRPRPAAGAEAAEPQPLTLERAVVTRFIALSVLAWAIAEALALFGLALALLLPPVPRLAITVYFTGGLFLWLLSRPAISVLVEARRRTAARA